MIGVFIAAGFLGALAGVILAAKLRIGQASVGLEYLLPRGSARSGSSR